MTARRAPKPPGPSGGEVVNTTGARPDERTQPEPKDAAERAWREHVTKALGEAEIEALGRELAGAEAFEASLSAAVAAMNVKADETESSLGPASARHVYDQADDLERRRERTAARVQHIKEQVAWRRKALKG